MHARWMLACLLLAGCGPDETTFSDVTSEIAVIPDDMVDFGPVISQTTSIQNLTIANAGRKIGNVTLEVTGDDAGLFTLGQTEGEIPSDEQIVIPITFTPNTYLPFEATLAITTDDPDNELIELPLLGEGVYAPSPELCIDPLSVDFGTVQAGSVDVAFVDIGNCGSADLDVHTFTQTGSGAFGVEAVAANTSVKVAPGSSFPMTVIYQPSNDLGDDAVVSFVTNDTANPTGSVTLIGNGGRPGFEWPEAVISDCNPAAPPEIVTLDGSMSTDPAGLGLAYFWALNSTPDGSQATLSQAITDTTSFFADLGGPYEVQLQVMDGLGIMSAPTVCTVDAMPADDIHVELTWDTSGIDLDLHLLQNTSAALYDVPADCSWCNSNPDWGLAGSDDDPRLDLDDQSDGPENINILSPADGSYPVYVHYYDPVGGGAVTATVTVYLNGTVAHTDSMVMTRNDVWKVGQINWPQATFGAYGDPLEAATSRQCQ